MASLTVPKVNSKDCGTGHRLSHDDTRVAVELGLEFVSVLLLQDTDTDRHHRRVLLVRGLRQAGDGLAHRSAGQRAGAGVGDPR